MFTKERLALEAQERWERRHPVVMKAKKEYMEDRATTMVKLVVALFVVQLLLTVLGK